MRHGLLGTVAAVAAIFATTAQADDTPPASAPNISLYVGTCLHPSLGAAPKGRQAAVLAGLLAVVAPALIDKAFDWVGAKLTALGADQKTTLTGYLAAEPQFGSRMCVQVARWKTGGRTLASLETWTSDYGLNGPRVPTGAGLDFFAEFWVRPSADGEAVSYTPTLIYYPALLGGHPNGRDDPLIAITAALAPVSGGGASGTWTLPTQTPTPDVLRAVLKLPDKDGDGKTYQDTDARLSTACAASCEGASPWYASPWADAKVDASSTTDPAHTPKPGAAAPPAAEDAGEQKPAPAPARGPKVAKKAAPPPPAAAAQGPRVIQPGGPAPAQGGAQTTDTKVAAQAPGAYAIKPINVSIQITEIRSGSKFFATLAEFFNAAKPGLETATKQALLPDQRAAAATAQMTADANALTTFATSITATETQRQTYCNADVNTANWTALSAALRATQLSANVAAAAAHQPVAFANPIAVGKTKDAATCPP